MGGLSMVDPIGVGPSSTLPRLVCSRWSVRLLVLAALSVGSAVTAHSGGLNAEGCHNDRKRGGYHCHGGGRARGAGLGGARSNRPRARPVAGLGAAFRNCAAARAAGAAPVRSGDPGYGRHLDRDGDGVGCE